MAQNHQTVHRHWTTSLFLLVIATYILTVHTETQNSWFWHRGCFKLNTSYMVINITNNSPITCLQSCDNGTKTIALQDTKCICNVNVSKKNDQVPLFGCDKPCPGGDVNFCGGVKENMWSVYKTAIEEELIDKHISVNDTGCISVKKEWDGITYAVQPCNVSSVFHLCSGFFHRPCAGLTSSRPAPNWTFSCGLQIGDSFTYEQYLDDFKRTEKCVSRDETGENFWTSLFSLIFTEPMFPTESTYMTTTTDIATTVESSISPFTTETWTSTITTDSTTETWTSTMTTDSSVLRNSSIPNKSRSTDKAGYAASTPSTTELLDLHSVSPLYPTSSKQNSSKPNKSRSTDKAVFAASTPSTTELLDLPSVSPLYSTSSEPIATTSIALITVGSVLIVLAIVFFAIVSARRRSVKRSLALNSSSQFNGHSSLALTMNTLPPAFQDERSRQIVNSVDMENSYSDFPVLTRSVRADLRMNGSSTFMSDRSTSLEDHVLY